MNQVGVTLSNKFDHISTEELLDELDKRKGQRDRKEEGPGVDGSYKGPSPSRKVPWWARKEDNTNYHEHEEDEFDRQQAKNIKAYWDNYSKLLDEWERKPYPKGPPPGI